MNKQMAESKFIQFVSSLRPDSTQHVPHLGHERDSPVEQTVSITANEILAVFIRRFTECSAFRDHLTDVAVKLGTQHIASERWNEVRDD